MSSAFKTKKTRKIERMLTKYVALMRRAMASMLEYRASIFIWMLTSIAPLVMLAAWFSLSSGGPIGDYAQSDFISYYLLILFLTQNTGVWVIWELDHEIKHGELSIKLLHPLNPIHEYLAEHIAEKLLFRLPIMTVFLIVAAWLLGGVHYQISLVTAPLFVLALIGAWILRFFVQYSFGLLAFWVSEAMTLNDIYFGFYMILGGIVAPLSLLPTQIASVAQYLPFRFMLSFPAEILLGKLSAADLAIGALTQWLWVLLVLAIYRLLWTRGLKVFSAYGA